jgi:hypothetical protein
MGGQVVVEASYTPVFDACRALLARGYTGTLVVQNKASSVGSFEIDIAKGAKLEVADGRIREWRSRPTAKNGN